MYGSALEAGLLSSRYPFQPASTTPTGIRIEAAATNQLYVTVDDDAGATYSLFAGGGDDFVNGSWVHVALVWDTGSSEFAGYVNGEEKFANLAFV